MSRLSTSLPVPTIGHLRQHRQRHQRRIGGMQCALLCVLLLAGLALGTLQLDLTQIWQALWRQGSPVFQTVIWQWRLPRLLMAITVGLALAIAGGVFQSLLRNPMGSPDVIGFNTGAWSGVLLTVVVWQGNELAMALGALLGGTLTALLIFALAWQRGLSRLRLIIIGIAVSALLNALNIWLMMSTTLDSAMTAVQWSVGSLNGMTWQKYLPVAAGILPCLLLCLLGTRPLQQIALGDDTASATGVPVHRVRLLLMLAATALTAIATAMTGPIPFIALAAPPITARLLGHPSPSLPHIGLTGALLVLAADLLAQHLLPGIQLPVGVISITLGGFYLLYLLITEVRTSS